jgi:hypothetical protein
MIPGTRHAAMSDLSPLCAAKRTFANVSASMALSMSMAPPPVIVENSIRLASEVELGDALG